MTISSCSRCKGYITCCSIRCFTIVSRYCSSSLFNICNISCICVICIIIIYMTTCYIFDDIIAIIQTSISQGYRVFTCCIDTYTISCVISITISIGYCCTCCSCCSGVSTISYSRTISCSCCRFTTISYCITSGCRCICLSTICLSNAIPCNNSCFTTCCFKGCRVQLHKVFIQGVCEVSFVLVHCEVFTSDQLNFVVFTNLSILLSTCLVTRSCSIFVCRDLPCLFPYCF